MRINRTSSVAEVARTLPQAVVVFDQLGIDYCCGGKKSLGEACDGAGLNVDDVVHSLEMTPVNVEYSAPDYSMWRLTDLVDHIMCTHHVFTRNELERLPVLIDRAVDAHEARHPELREIQSVFEQLEAELTPHLLKEEQVLFPYIIALEQAHTNGSPLLPPPFRTVRNPVRMLMAEHETAGHLLQEMRRLSTDYSVPEDGCLTYRALFNGLKAFEKDLHRHIHLENNILFPRAAAIEVF